MAKCVNPIRYLLLILCLLSIQFIHAQIPIIDFKPVNDSVISATDIVNAADGSKRFFVTLREGTIKVFDSLFNYIGDFLSVPDVISTGGEQGLLNIAFGPNYTSNGYFYIFYTGNNGNEIVARYTRSAIDTNKADTNSKVILLNIPKPVSFDPPYTPFEGHNGGTMNFGPEGYLYISIGDGGSGYDPYNNAQDGNSLFGKMLRLDVSNPDSPYYFIPTDNPYNSNPSWRHELWSIGFRNPWKWSFDRQTHDLWISDVGQRDREEIDYRAASNTGGVNFGWHCYEGSIETPTVTPPCTASVVNYVPPIFDYAHDANGGQAVIGGYVYRGSEFPDLQGYFICADYVSRNVWLIKYADTGWLVQKQHTLPSTLFTFGEAENGEIYAAGNQGIYKIELAINAPLPVKLVLFTLKQESNANQIDWKTASESNIREFVVEFSTDGIHYNPAGKPVTARNINGASYSFGHIINNDQTIFYRLKISEQDNRTSYSKVISTYSKNYRESLKINPTISHGEDIQVELNTAFRSIRIFNIYGQLIYQELTGGRTGVLYLNTGNWAKGMYTIVADNSEIHISKKFIVN